MANFGNYGSGKFNQILVKDLTVTDDVTISGDWAVTGTLAVTSTSTFTGAVSIDDTTATTSGITGSLHTDGGVGIAGALYVGTTSALVGNVTVGSASGAGADVRFYGDLATADFFWDQDGDTNGSLTLGADTKGVDFKAFGVTTGNYVIWDQSADDLLLVGTATQLGVAGTTASTTTATGSIHTAGGLGVAGAMFIAGAISVVPAAAGTFLDFLLETEWVSGTLINADFASSTTFSGTVIGLNLDLGTNIVATSERSVTGVAVKLPAMTMDAASPALVGLDISAAGAFTLTTSGTASWSGIEIGLPNTTQTAGAVTSYGVHITQGTVTSGTQYGIYMDGGAAYLPMQVGVKANTSGSGLKIVGSGDNSGGVQLYADDGGAAAAGEVITPLRVRYLLTAAQSGGVTQTATFSQLVTLGTTGAPLVLNTGAWRASYVFAQLGGTTIQGGAEVVGINQATTLAGNMIVTSGRFSGVDINIAGDGTITNNSVCAALLIRSSGTPVWPNGLQVTSALVGINMATTTQGVVSVVSALPANARGDSFKYTCATPAMSDGYGAFEVDLTTSGTGTGNAAASSSWVNIPTGVAASGGYIAARTDGIWEAAGAQVSGAYLVFGAKMTADIGDTDFDRLVPFCLNSTQDMSALFMIGSPDSKVGIVVAGGGNSSAVGSAAMFIDSNDAVYYVKLYSDPAS